MRFLSVCSGIEAASVAWESLGWEAIGFSEIEPFPSAVLKHHYPNVPNYGDMTALAGRITAGEIEAPDLLCGGTPCQAFSVAGLRKSLDDARGNLTLTFCEIANAIDNVRAVGGREPCIVFWENVPGVLNTKDNAFGCFLGELAGESCELQPPGGRWKNAGLVLGPQRAVAWRVLDAQYFGVAQRRRRVFVVASARDGFNPAKVLFEFEGVRRDSAPRREARESVAGTIAARFGISRNIHEECVAATVQARMGSGGADADTETLVPAVAGSLDTQCGGGKLTHQSVANGHIVAARMVAFGEYVDDGTASAMKARDWKDATDLVAQPSYIGGVDYEHNPHTMDEPTGPLLKGSPTGGGHALPAVATAMQVRRLTPTECERLQGFPDGYTNIPWRNKPEAPDGPRYKALGNSWAVPVVAWIGRRIAVEAL